MSGPKKSLFLTSALAAAGLASLPAHGKDASAGPDTRPNIVFAISDDQSWIHAGAYGTRGLQTPTFDRIAREGVLFTRAFCSSPSCTPSRAAILTGQVFSRLEESANLWSTLDAKFPVYPDLLEKAGYRIGLTGKGWSPGDLRPGGRNRNPAGPHYKDFSTFLASVPEGKPFCYWFGSTDPHRPYVHGSGLASGKSLSDATVPPFLPDAPEVRSDILDYYFEVERFDREVGNILRQLEKAGKLDNTIVVMTSDNGMPFPRAKANVYDYGARMPLAVRWPARVPPNRVVEDFVSFPDFAPTFLEAAGLKPLPEMTGRSLLPLLVSKRSGRIDRKRDRAYIGRERHANVRAGNLGYPIRAVRTDEFLYIRNFEPDRWPAGDPPRFGDIDNGPTKAWMMEHRDDPGVQRLFDLAFGKRPAEELYDLRKDPYQMRNVASDTGYAKTARGLRSDLDGWMKRIKDPRAFGEGDRFDRYPYVSPGRNRTPMRRAPIPASPAKE
ncbi:MAG: sulfatase-like hydrolase/transferase [Armatimonadetes bacterium]|nr:sulfatase-like hydrolase/transferase [Armatimonadota bacterium]